LRGIWVNYILVHINIKKEAFSVFCMWCERCGASDENVRLVDVISPEGIVKLCEACSVVEGYPILKRPTTAQLKEAEKPAYYGRYIRGSNVNETKKRIESFGKPGTSASNVEDDLREIMNRNYQKKLVSQSKPRADLVDNFHWMIMRARRFKKMSQKELAREISEAEAAIIMAERGILPEDDYKLVKNLEAYLGVQLLKDDARKSLVAQREAPARILNVDPDSMKNLTIDDLRKMKSSKSEGELPVPSPGEHDYQEEIDISDEDYPEFEEDD